MLNSHNGRMSLLRAKSYKLKHVTKQRIIASFIRIWPTKFHQAASAGAGNGGRWQSNERNELADRLVCLGKQQTWQGEVFAVPSGDVAELVIAEQRSWRERSLGAGSNVFRYLRDDPGG
ncbi:hypothetical protein V6N13_086197 [Hibiscus sabdariffa]